MPTFTNYAGEISTHLDEFRTKGHKEASQNRPPSDSTRMDQNEAAVQLEAEKWLTTEQRLFDAVLTEAARSVIDLQQKSIELKTKIEFALSDDSMVGAIEADMAGDRKDLISATENRLRAEVDWKYFRAENNIHDQAVYPDSHIWHFSLIALLALIETGINAFFYENAQGLLGGFTVALGVAAINMLGAMGLGYGFRYKNLVVIDKKILGWLCLLAFAILSVYCNALFASFRAEYQILSDPSDAIQLRQAFAQASIEAKKIFWIEMRFADLISLILFAVGFLLSCFAFYKGYTFDDRYPGYGERDRALKKAQKIELERQDLLRQKVKDSLIHKRGEIQGLVHEPAQIVTRAASRVSELQHAHSLLLTQAQAIQRDFALLLGTYRTANTSVRATDPPAYFKETPDLTDRVSGDAGKPTIVALEGVQENMKNVREAFQEPLNERLKLLQSNSAEILNSTFSQFLQSIESDAQEKITRMTPNMHREI